MFFIKRNRSSQPVADKDLLEKYFESGEPEYLGILFSRYLHLVYGVCMKYFRDRDESKDAVMEIFEKIFKVLRKDKVEDFNRWIYTVTRNHCLTSLRDRKRHMLKDEGLIPVESEENWHHKDDGIMEENIEKLRKCLETLPEQQKTCVELFYFHRKSYRQIMDETRFEENKVKSYIQNGKRNLRICIEKSENGKPG